MPWHQSSGKRLVAAQIKCRVGVTAEQHANVCNSAKRFEPCSGFAAVRPSIVRRRFWWQHLYLCHTFLTYGLYFGHYRMAT